jgi:hypothetical protein
LSLVWPNQDSNPRSTALESCSRHDNWYSWKHAKLALNNNHSLYFYVKCIYLLYLISVGEVAVILKSFNFTIFSVAYIFILQKVIRRLQNVNHKVIHFILQKVIRRLQNVNHKVIHFILQKVIRRLQNVNHKVTFWSIKWMTLWFTFCNLLITFCSIKWMTFVIYIL